MYEKHARHTRRFRPMAPLLILLIATIFTGALALEGSSSGDAASERPNISSLPSTGKPVVASSLPQTVTNKIAFTSARRAGQNYIQDIWVMNADGSGPTNLTADVTQGGQSSPSWSPDGSKIAYTYSIQGPGPGIYIINSDGTNRVHIGPDSNIITSPAWSPLGDKIAYTNASPPPGYFTDIYVMNTSGGNITNLTNGSVGSTSPAWSPDGSKIAFQRNSGSGNDIWVMNADGTNQTNITNTPSIEETTPAWSPDGTLIAFTGPGASVSEYDIWVMNANGTNRHDLTNNPNGSESHATWSSDSTKIAYSVSVNFGPGEIFVMNANGGSPVNITNDPGNDIQPAWSPGSLSLVQVKDEQGNPVPGAEVYRNCILLGNTDSRGVVGLASPALSDHLIARTLVYTGTTPKSNHGGWMYHVWLTNIRQENDGTQTDYTITDTNKITQTVTLKKDNAQIGLNLVASVEYNATSANLSDIATGLKKASTYLLDVTDGQMFIEKSTLYEDNQNFADADIQFFPSEWPSADVRGIVSATGHLYMPGPGFNGQFIGSWAQPIAYRTFVHELGHYAFGAYDEYKVISGTQGTAICTLDRNLVPSNIRASIMDRQYNSTEICADNNHNPNTEQGQILGESVWATFLRNWRDGQDRWTIRTPITRGSVDPGPDTAACINTPTITIIESLAIACAPISAHTVITSDGGNRLNASNVSVYLSHSGRQIDEGPTDGQGEVSIYGASSGDVITATGNFNIGGTNVPYAASATINSCGASPLLILRRVVLGPPAAAVTPDTPDTPDAVNGYWLTGKHNHTAGTVDLSIHFDGPPSSAPSLSLSQDGGPNQPVNLTYDPPTYTYSASIAYDSARALHFLASLGVATSTGSLVSTHLLVGDTFSSSGPFIGEGVQQTPRSFSTPQAWEMFSSENIVSLAVNASSMANGTGLLVGTTNMPPGTPPNLLAVGGPYSIDGESPITGQVSASLNFQADLYCGLQPGSISIYHYDPSGGAWTQIPTNLNMDWNQAYANITQWGIYAVFAQPNTVPAFSDVPDGSTYFDYVQWIACHGIASGYADGSFHVGSNATRGQISKMIALAYHWNLEPPSGEGQESASGGLEPFQWRWKKANDTSYTFADVLPGSTFYLYIETAYQMGVFNGYTCGGPGEPCDPQNRPYFRPSNNATRGQIAKILSIASLFDEPATGQTFEDVPPTHTFYQYVERMASRSIIGGYQCGGQGEPCVQPGNRPYFRPQNDATRGQLSKMIYLTLRPR